MKKYAIGADIGGGHITTALVNLTDAIMVEDTDCRLKVDAEGKAEDILNAWTESVKKTIGIGSDKGIGQDLIAGIGIAMPGPFDYPNGICLIKEQAKFRTLYQMNIREELAKRTGFKSGNIRFKNDAECFLLGEIFGGAAKGSNRCIGITLGTGFGSAYCINGVSEDADLWCAPFKGKIAEYYISTNWFIRRYEELSGVKVHGAKDLVDGVVNETDEKAKQVFSEFAVNLRDFLVPLVKEKHADTVIIGGNIALSEHIFTGLLRKDLSELAPPVRVVITALGEEAALMGSACLLKE